MCIVQCTSLHLLHVQLYTAVYNVHCVCPLLFKCRVKEKDNLDPEKLTHVKEEVQKDFYIYFFMNYH